jgi:hypothetical protein
MAGALSGILLVAMLLAPTAAMAITKSQAKKITKSQVTTIILAESKRAHLSKANTAAMLWIVKRESNFHPTSKNPSGCYGLFQLSWGMAKKAPHGQWWDPTWNTRRAIRYMKGRYGSPSKARSFWLRHRWY